MQQSRTVFSNHKSRQPLFTYLLLLSSNAIGPAIANKRYCEAAIHCLFDTFCPNFDTLCHRRDTAPMGPMRPIHKFRANKKNTVKSTSALSTLPLLIGLTAAGLISAPAPEAKAQTSKARNAAAKEKATARQEREATAQRRLLTTRAGQALLPPTLRCLAVEGQSLQGAGRGAPHRLARRGERSQRGVGVRRDEIVEAAKLRLTFTLSLRTDPVAVASQADAQRRNLADSGARQGASGHTTNGRAEHRPPLFHGLQPVPLPVHRPLHDGM